MLWGNLATAVAYFVISSQLLLFVFNPKVSTEQLKNQITHAKSFNYLHAMPIHISGR